MANNRIKGLTIQIGADTSPLSKALKDVNSEIKTTQAELRDVEKLLKLDPTNTELLEQRQKLLAKQVEQTGEKLKTLREAEKQLKDSGVDENSEQFMNLRREIIETEQSMKSLEQAAAASNATMAKIGATADQISAGAQKVADKTKALSAAAAGLVAGAAGMAYKAAQTADELNTLSKQTGITTDDLQKFKYAEDLIDVSADAVAKSFQKMKQNMASTSSATVEAWNRLGIATQDASGEYREANDVFYETLAALSQIENDVERDTLAQTVFGKSAAELTGIIDDGGAALKAYGDEAENLGLILDTETLTALNEANDTIDKTKARAQALLSVTGAKALEALTPVLEKIIDALGRVFEWIGNLNAEQIQTGLAIAAAVAAISPIAGIIAKISGAVSSLIPLISKAFSFLSANPIILIAGAVAALAVLVIKNWDAILAALKAGWDKIKAVIDTVKTYVWDNIIVPVGNFFIELINGIINAINVVIRALNKIQITLPNWGILGDLAGKSFGVNIGEIGQISTLQSSADRAAASMNAGTTIPTAAQPYNTSGISNAAALNELETQTQTNVNIEFTGSLAQLGRVLQPVVSTESARLGGSLVR